MEVVYRRCCGLDVHKRTVVACRIIPADGGQPEKEIRSFGTMTADLLALSDWLTEGGVTHVSLESTGVYWKPIWNLLEGSFTLLLVNAQHIKQVPGHKSDVKDSEWLADLLRHGLLKPSFVPARPQRELRELTRYRTSLIGERAAEVNRLQKTLEGANIKLAAVASDVLGVSGRQILAALVAGQTEAGTLAQLAKGRLREKLPQLERALQGQFGAHQQFLVARQLAHLDDLEGLIEEVSTEIARRLAVEAERPGEAPDRPFAKAVERVITITGVHRRIAETVLAEIGTDMSRFRTAGHLAAWAGLVPGLNESAGKRRSSKTRKGSPWLRAALVQAAHAASRTKGTYLAAQYHRLAARRGRKKAAIAVAHSILVIIYHLLQNQTTYDDLGGGYFEVRDKERIQRRLVRRLEEIGYKVTVELAPAA
jgi:transposase